MVAYSFKKRFEEPIRTGEKVHTLRNDRMRHARPGEFVQLYVGMRTRSCRKILMPDPICTAVRTVEIAFTGTSVGAVTVDGMPEDVIAFARSDGFDSPGDMFRFWRQEHGRIDRWSGVMVVWDPAQRRPV